MIQTQSILKVADNSGAKTVRCIKVLGGFQRKYAKLKDIIVISIQSLRNKSKSTSKVKKKEVYKALVIRTKTKHKKNSGFFFEFKENSVVLLNKQGNPVGTRIIGPLPKIFLNKKFQKFISIASGTI